MNLSRFGIMRKQYLKEQYSIFYTNLFVSGKLFDYLEKFDNEMNEFYDRLVEQYKIKWNVTEELKEND